MLEKIFKRTEQKNQEYTWLPPKNKVKYPRWSFVNIKDTQEYYIIWDNTKLSFVSERAFISWGKNPLIVSKESISHYQTWKQVGFSPGSLIESITDGKRYFISGKLFEEEKRLIATPDFYSVLGFNPNLAIVVSEKEINFHKEGSIIDDVRFISTR